MSTPLSRDRIVDAATARLVADGLAGVTLRRIATDLGVSAPTLLWHFKNKRELLDAVAAKLLADGRTGLLDTPEPGQPWWAWLEERTTWAYHQLAGIRDAPLVVAGNRPTPDMFAGTNAALGALVGLGFKASEGLWIFFSLGGYITGMALEAQASAGRGAPSPEHQQVMEAAFGSGRYPHLEAAAGADLSPDAVFEYGLGLLIRGIRQRHTEIAADH